MSMRQCIKTVTRLLVCLILLAGTSASARDVISTSFTTDSVDLRAVLERIETENAEVRIDLPPTQAGAPSSMVATASVFALRHRWAVFSLQNKTTAPQDLVIASDWQGFVGSGLFWPSFGKQNILSVQSAPGLHPIRLVRSAGDAFAFRINPGETVTYAVEVNTAGLDNLILWKRTSYASHRQDVSTFQGMLLGFALLISIGVLCLFVIRPQWVFPAAALFAWAATVFLALEFGYAGWLKALMPGIPDWNEKSKAISEALMAAGFLGCLLTFVDLRRRMALIAALVLIALLGGLGLAVWGWFRPDVVSGIARMAFAVTAIAATLIALMLTSKGAVRAKASLFFFVAALIWATVSAIAVFEQSDAGMYRFLVSSGLVLLMGVMILVIARFAFSRGVIHSKFFEDSGRRALALAGSEQTVWDWQEDDNTLYVGPELERALGLPQGKLTRGGLRAWLAQINPDDRSAYVSAVEAAVQRGRGAFVQQFRLRREDNSFRWFELRARAMPGEEGRATRCIGTLTDITSSKRAEDNLLFDALRDRVTDLPNRAIFIDRLEVAMRRAADEETTGLHVLVIDLDRLKSVNDGLGYAAGDHILMTMSRRLKELAESEDTLARLSGDLFGLIVDVNETERGVEGLAEAIRAHLSDPVEVEGRELFLSASIGIAPYRNDATTAETLLKDAEIALYEGKRSGKSKAQMFSRSMSDERSELIHLESELRRAIERDEMEVLYQPITRLSDEDLAGFEALIRWRHPDRGLLGPEEFISLAEESGLIEDLGRFVLNEAARQLGIWQRAFRPKEPLFVSINMSHSELLGRNLIDEVQVLLTREDLAPGTLKIEITESMVMQNPALSVQVLQQLKQLGVSLACDDFGTGYSSLATLHRLPFDVLKLDKSFLEAGPEDETSTTIIQTIIELAGKLDLVVVAEGIEEKEQANWLADLGCDLAQGYYYGEPMTARKVIDALGGSPLLSRYQGSKSGGLLKRVFGGDKNEQEADMPVAEAPAPSLPAEPAPVAAEPEPAVSEAVAAPPPPPPPPPAARAAVPEPQLPADLPADSPIRRIAKVPPPARPSPPLHDDLSKILDIDADTAKHLNQMNYASYRKLAVLTSRDIGLINDKLGSPGRVEREEWVQQARDLLDGKPPRRKRLPVIENPFELPAAPPADAKLEPVEPAPAPPPPAPTQSEPAGPERFEERLQRIGRSKREAQKAAEARRVEEEAARLRAQEEAAKPPPPEDAGEVAEADDLVLPRPPISRSAEDTGETSVAEEQDSPEPEAAPEPAPAPDEERSTTAETKSETVDAPEAATPEAEEIELKFEPAIEEEAVPAKPAARQLDDLGLISGIGPTMVRDLKILGITSYKQIADLSDEEAEKLGARLGFPNRIEREEWREQAADLQAGNKPRADADREALKRKLMGIKPDPEPEPQPVSDGSDDGQAEPIENDDVSLISGIGPSIARDLEELGITSLSQILALNDERIAEIENHIGFPGRIEREEWREQAAELLAGQKPRAKVDRERAELDASDGDTLPNPLAASGEPEVTEDDLTKIKGVGPALARELKQLGYMSFGQIASLTPEQMEEIDKAIGFPGRVERENWVSQAKEFTQA